MMIHEKLMSGQFLLDLKNDRASMLHHAAPQLATSHHLHHHNLPPQYALHQQLQQHHHQQQQPPSPPMSALKMDIYSAYAYQQQQQQFQQRQQQFIGGGDHPPSHHHHQSAFGSVSATSAEMVLDLSRRCDSVETPPSRKTPSPYQTNSSFGTGSPAASPTSNQRQLHQLQHQQIPANLLYSAQAAQQKLPVALSSLYPTLYYPAVNVKQEPVSPPPPQVQQLSSAAAAAAATNLLQTFASAAAVVASSNSAMTADDEEINVLRCSPKTAVAPAAVAATPTSSPTVANDSNKTTPTQRPFKAFPRDPLVIAANFAATDVLLDNPRVERYTEYRKRVLEQIRSSNGGSRTITNPKMRRTNSGGSGGGSSSSGEERSAVAAAANAAALAAGEDSSDCDSNAGGNYEKMSGGSACNSMSGNQKDAAYYERRRKNNAAAKKSRDRRRIKEDEIAIRAAYLERQNIELLCQIDALKAQLSAYTAAKIGA